MRSDIKDVLSKLGHLPTKQDLFQNIATVAIIGLTVLALTVGGIIGGLAWLQPKTPAPAPAPGLAATAPTQPIVIQLPPQPPTDVPAPTKGKGG